MSRSKRDLSEDLCRLAGLSPAEADGLVAKVPARRVRNALDKLKQTGESDLSLKLGTFGRQILAQDEESAWNLESGQGFLAFTWEEERRSSQSPFRLIQGGGSQPVHTEPVHTQTVHTQTVRTQTVDSRPVHSQPIPALDGSGSGASRFGGARKTGGSPDASASHWFSQALELEELAGADGGRTRDWEASRDAYLKALEIEPGHFDAALNLGRLYHQCGEFEAAITLYDRALGQEPGDATALFNLGVALEDLARPTDALECYEKAVASDDRMADAWFNLARIYEGQGQKHQALSSLKRYRDLIYGAR